MLVCKSTRSSDKCPTFQASSGSGWRPNFGVNKNMQKHMQQPQCQPTSVDKCVMLPHQHCDGSNSCTARNHSTSYETYLTYQTRQGNINTFDKFKTMFALTETFFSL